MEKQLEEYEKEVKELCETRLNVSKLKSTDPWTIDDLNLAIKDLDNGKARDALGHANELFKQEVAGTDLLLGTLKFMNHIKKKSIGSQSPSKLAMYHCYTRTKALARTLCSTEVCLESLC